MKKGILIAVGLVLILAICSTGYAAVTGDGGRNANHQHRHSYYDDKTSKYKTPLGVELDVTLFKSELIGIPYALGVDGEYDLNNGTWGCMAKMSIDLSGAIKAMFGRK